jgi:hypothetical protein
MKLAIVTVWYNEEDLAPFFLEHYSYVDDIYVYLDTDTNDSTRSICKAHPKVTLRSITYPKGYDPGLQVQAMNKAVRSLEHDWVYAVDADEFIQQPKQYRSAKEFLYKQEQVGYNLVIARMYQVYRHVTDKDLDINKPVLEQRRHGDPDLSTAFNRCYIKPIVVKPEVGVVWRVGCHKYRGHESIRPATEHFIGAHWKMADPKFASKRRISGIRDRLSRGSIQRRRCWQDSSATKKSILGDLKRHSRDPDVLGSLLP